MIPEKVRKILTDNNLTAVEFEEGNTPTGVKAAARIGTNTKVRMATPEETLKATGFNPGGVCPFGVEGITIFIDRGLQKYETIYPAAGTDSSGVPVGFDKLLAVTGCIPCNIIQDKEQD